MYYLIIYQEAFNVIGIIWLLVKGSAIVEAGVVRRYDTMDQIVNLPVSLWDVGQYSAAC